MLVAGARMANVKLVLLLLIGPLGTSASTNVPFPLVPPPEPHGPDVPSTSKQSPRLPVAPSIAPVESISAARATAELPSTGQTLGVAVQ